MKNKNNTSTAATTQQVTETARNFVLRYEDGSVNWAAYDVVIVAFSGGKDSLACLLHILDLGCPREKIELWHHDIDGKGKDFMDWECTPGYCRGVAAAVGIKLFFSWKVGGFEGEMLRQDAPTGAVAFETPTTGLEVVGGDSKSLGTRLLFPQMSANLEVRWCSGYLKIDVAARAITNQPRFLKKNTLFITGERGEESAARAEYATEEAHRSDNRAGKKPRQRVIRRVDHWRPVHAWTTGEVWEIIRRYRVKAHPCYRLGWGRCSCACCIFGNANQWASIREVSPAQFAKVANYEKTFGKTIDRNKVSIEEKANNGEVYSAVRANPAVVKEAHDRDWDRNNTVIEDVWTEPSGMVGELCGPC